MPIQGEGGSKIPGQFPVNRIAVWLVCRRNGEEKWPRGQMSCRWMQIAEIEADLVERLMFQVLEVGSVGLQAVSRPREGEKERS